ncbi:MAG: amidohydrolase family protein [Leptospiraceae bacterium]|nr:amidohydrolase family protein [Leptospiraceae bacterium]
MKWQMINASLLPAKSGHGLVFAGGRIDQVLEKREGLADILAINLHGMLVLPGFINAHDSLLATWHAPPASESPYRNWLSWDNTVKASPFFQERMRLEMADLYELGGYKNIIGGATTVVDHVPAFVRDAYREHSLAWVLPEYGIAHSLCSYSLDWGSGFRREYDYAVENDLPFIMHIAEGSDVESRESLQRLDDLGVLGEHSVLVHGIGLSERDLDLIAERGASLVWCPAMNQRIYLRSLNVKAALERQIPVSLGTDSAMTGSSHYLHEIKAARECYSAMYDTTLELEQLLPMLIDNSVKAFRIKDRGLFSADQVGDLVVFNARSSDELDDILNDGRPGDIFMVIRNGQPVYGNSSLQEFFDLLEIEVVPVSIDGQKRLVMAEYGQLIQRLQSQSANQAPFAFLPMELV